MRFSGQDTAADRIAGCSTGIETRRQKRPFYATLLRCLLILRFEAKFAQHQCRGRNIFKSSFIGYQLEVCAKLTNKIKYKPAFPIGHSKLIGPQRCQRCQIDRLGVWAGLAIRSPVTMAYNIYWSHYLRRS